MSKIVVVNEAYLADYYNKRKLYNQLETELEEMSKTIKLDLERKHVPLGNTYGKYVASITIKNKLNSNFTQMLKNNGLQDRITEVCYIKDCKDIVSSFSKEEQDKYFEFWYKQLWVRKK